MKYKPLPKSIRRKLERVTEKILSIQEKLCASKRTHVADALDKLRKDIQAITYGQHKVIK